MKIKEQLDVIIKHHPHHESLNKKIIEESKVFSYCIGGKNPDGSESNLVALKSIGFASSPSLELIHQWVLTFIQKRGYSFYVSESWVANYMKEEYALSHKHTCSFSFVYFVRCPKGSAPLVFTTSGKRIKAEEGRVVIFPGNLYHHVPKNKCDGRIVVAGNIYFDRT